ncbi:MULTISPECIES: methyltransferase domain-containing protein [Streptomyces]|uniref:methyltransferase domain-containing protein n=1 Tax=Streptomyces TaxID=1883 RepID=UPI001F1AC4CE|nr:methyltransferase domain-containing protein [Streptomyces sp. A1-5]UJB40558.1 methyltransferase domain-containing protein [Streptomyces sp. A1-5]
MPESSGTRSGFGRVDAADRPAVLIGCLDGFAALPGVQAAKQRSFAMGGKALEREPVLDVGCGTGTDLVLWGRQCGARPVGVDLSHQMLTEARARAGDCSVMQAHSHHLPFRDGVFAAVRGERLLLHDTDPSAAVAEMARVVRPGGCVVLVEPDMEEAAATCPTLYTESGSLTAWVRSSFAQPRSGSAVRRLLGEHGLVSVQSEVHRERCDAETADTVLQLRACALWAHESRGAPPGQLRRWLSDLHERDSGSAPFCTVPIHVASATRPTS